MRLFDTLASYLLPPDQRPLKQIEREIVDELQFHLEMRTRDNVCAGMPSEAARLDARRRFGDFRRIHKSCRGIQMGERIMLQRVQVALTASLLVVVLVMAIGFYKRQSQYDAALTDLQESIDKMHSGLSGVLDAAQPVVVSTQPARGATDTDPNLKEIRVTFSKKMLPDTWSWTENIEHPFPETTGDAFYLDDQETCVLPVKLEPQTEYLIWINSENHRGFKDKHGQAAVPYALYFTTRSAP